MKESKKLVSLSVLDGLPDPCSKNEFMGIKCCYFCESFMQSLDDLKGEPAQMTSAFTVGLEVARLPGDLDDMARTMINSNRNNATVNIEVLDELNTANLQVKQV